MVGGVGFTADQLSALEVTIGLPAIHRAQAGLISDLDYVADVVYGRAAKRQVAA